MLQKGTFQFPDLTNFSSAGIEIDSALLGLILQGIDLSSIRRRVRYRSPGASAAPQTPSFGAETSVSPLVK